MRPRIVVLHVMLVAAVIAAWRAAMLEAFWSLGAQECALLAALSAYFVIGVRAAWVGDWSRVDRIANALSAWGLAFTGVGLLLAASHLHSLTPAALSQVFRELVFAIAPNIIGVFGFAWLTTLADWASGSGDSRAERLSVMK